VITRLRVGGVTLAIRSAENHPALVLSKRFAPFQPRSGDDIALVAERRAVPEPNEDDLLFDSGGTWRVYRRGRSLLYVFRPPMGEGAPARGVLIDERRRRGRLFFRPPYDRRRGFALGYPLDELIFQHHLARAGGLVAHACGVAFRGRALAFCGPSGAGKSTTARLWLRHQDDAAILSDDRLVLRRHGGRWRAHGTPWHGSARLASPREGPLHGLVFLEQADRTRLHPLAVPETAALLLAHTFPPLWEREGVAATLASASRLAAAVPGYVLRFRKDASAVAAVRPLFAPDRAG
jgi:hypothetical protein